jgi:tubulysin polyketide synthase-like protein
MVMDSYRSNDVVEVISRLIGAGARLWAEGDRLRYSGPAGVLTAEDEAFIAAHKGDVLRAVSEGVAARCPVCYATAQAKPDERTDPRYSDLWQGWCLVCGAIFSTAQLAGLIESERVN